jgi:hypothetical protein
MLWFTHLTCEFTYYMWLSWEITREFDIIRFSQSRPNFIHPCRVKTRLQVQVKRKATDAPPTGPEDIHYTSTWHAITKIVDDDGILGLYNGINGALLGVASTNFAYFYWYSVVRTLYLARQTVPTPPGTAVELTLGAAAGAVAQLFTIPIAVVTTRQQTQSKADRKGMIDTAKEVVHSEDGWTGLWRGLKASLVLVVNPAITYGTYQRLREVMFPGKLNLRPGEAFRKFEWMLPQRTLLTSNSAWSSLKIPCNDRDTAFDCR